MRIRSDSREVRAALSQGLSTFGRTPELKAPFPWSRPTETVCMELQGLFDVFNTYLFASELPDCMLTVDIACRAAFGYFRPDAFTKADGQIVDQISLNPTFMLNRPMKDVAGTVAHEMAHQWMHRCSGERMAGGYHCKTWGRKMKAIGLMPSNTGKPGGRQTGYQMTHYPIPDGPFLAVVAALEAHGFAITWGRFQRTLKAGTGTGVTRRDDSKGKVKFVCPQCGQCCWGSPALEVICGKDRCRMTRPLS